VREKPKNFYDEDFLFTKIVTVVCWSATGKHSGTHFHLTFDLAMLHRSCGWSLLQMRSTASLGLLPAKPCK